MAFTPSLQQQNILAAVANSRCNMVIDAGAGSGKTTTLIQVYKQLRGRSIFLAFGKANQLDLEAKGVPARTFNSLGFGALRNAMRCGQVSMNKVRDHLRSTLLPADDVRYTSFAAKLVDLAKNAGIGAMVDDVESNWFALIDKHDLELNHDDAFPARGVEIARHALRWSSNPDTIARIIDFNDQVYLPVMMGLSLPKFDNVLTDESQDLNSIQRVIVRKILAAGGRLIAVGDRAQAIFGFRGADADSLDQLAEEFDCERFPLTVSYRCGTDIVDYARQFGAIDAAPGAIKGSVRTDVRDYVAEAAPGDLFVCRLTKPLLEAAYGFLKQHKRAYIMGREIGEGLVSLINKMKAKSLEQLAEKLEAYTLREVEKAIAKGKESKAESIQDKTDCVLFLIDTVQEDDRTVPGLVRVITDLFADKAGAVVLATIHKAKGLEARRVYWLCYDFYNKRARQDWQMQQEVNLQYVAATRAKEELVLVGQNHQRNDK